jgi:hypothetical protein
MKPPRPPQPAEDRDARLKAALKANLARRKAQARARGETVAAAGQAEPAGRGEGKG